MNRRLVVSVVAMFVAVGGFFPVHAQRGVGPPIPSTAKASAPIDLTGYWVSVISEDWRFRMMTPPKGDFRGVPLTTEGLRVANAWNPAAVVPASDQCKAYGAGAIMRVPGRLHINWQDDNTLRLDTDAGTQTRLFVFGAAPAAAEPSWQGQSFAEWQYAPAARGAVRSGNLKVVTTNLRAGYVRKNGAPYSTKATVTEYYDLNAMPNGDRWFTVTTKVDDPVYSRGPYLTTTDFKKLPDASGWNPTACSAR